MATLTITLSPEVIKALRDSRSISVALGSSAPGGGAKTPASGTRGSEADDNGGFREGTLPAKLMQWTGGRKKAFGVPDVMKAMKIKRGHASMLLAYVMRRGVVKRVGRGSYMAA